MKTIEELVPEGERGLFEMVVANEYGKLVEIHDEGGEEPPDRETFRRGIALNWTAIEEELHRPLLPPARFVAGPDPFVEGIREQIRRGETVKKGSQLIRCARPYSAPPGLDSLDLATLYECDQD